MHARTVEPDRVTRLAPSPTGALHLGNARSFMINWTLARQRGWRIVLRVEDLDSPRVKPWAVEQAIEDLRWLGLDWDDGPTYQLADLSPYERALAQLAERGLTYRCSCTRKEIEAAQSAPHGDEHELRYPGTCRPSTAGESRAPNEDCATRLIVPNEPIAFDDAFAGPQSHDVQQAVGDFVVATKRGLPAYQLAVVVDDARQGVTDIVRGDDLLGSAARQLWLYRLLGLTPLPRYWHLPLVLGPDGRRLAKRHGDTRLSFYRERGVSPQRVIALLARWSGCGSRESLDATTFADTFDIEKLPRTPAVFTEKDHRWLLEDAE